MNAIASKCGIALALRQLAEHLARARVGDEEVDREEIALGEERDTRAVRGQHGGQVHLARVDVRRQHALPRRGGSVAALEERLIVVLRGGHPDEAQRVRVRGEDRARADVDAFGSHRLVELRHPRVAPAPADEGPERVAPAIREEARVAPQVLDLGELVVEDRVPQPHRRVRVLASDRQVLGQPLDDPERQALEPLLAARHRDLLGDVVLERVHELVAQHVVRVAHRLGERHDDPVLEALREPARRLREGRGRGVRLVEVRLVGIEDQRLPLVELVVEHRADAAVPALRHPPRVEDQVRVLLGVAVDVEALGLDDVPVEVLVLDLVAPEVLRLGGARQDRGQPDQQRRE